jgi:putative transposase
MLKGNLFRIYPTESQKHPLEQHFGAVRFIYNKLLHIKSTLYSHCRCSVSKLDLANHIQVLKDCYPWLKDIYAHSLLSANSNLDSAYQKFFKGLGAYPKEHKKKDNHFSYQYPDGYQINLTTSQIYLPNIGWIKTVFHKDLFNTEFIEKNFVVFIKNGQRILRHGDNKAFLRTLTVSRTPTGKYHISILTEDGIEEPETKPITQKDILGVDLGLKTFAACSNGDVIDNPKFLKNSENRLEILQKRVSKKVKGSKNRKKAVLKLTKLHEKIYNQRNDFLHKASMLLVRENQAIALETLNIQGMQKNHKLAKAVSDVGWNSFVTKIEYKAKWVGKTVLKIGQWEPSSKECHVCGYHNTELTLDIREWLCPECNAMHDRDINAAINIKKFAILQYQIPDGTTGKAYGLGKNEITAKNEVGSLTALQAVR